MVFRDKARGDALPLCTFDSAAIAPEGSYGGMTVDFSGKLWVSVTSTPAVVAFERGVSGSDVVPSQVISGPRTLLPTIGYNQLQQPTTDANGNLWVPASVQGGAYLIEFSASANGNAKPIQTIGYKDRGKGEGLSGASGLAFDHEGNLWVAEDLPSVAVFAPPFSEKSRPIAIYNLGGVSNVARFIGIDKWDDVYVGNPTNCNILLGGLKSKGKIGRSFAFPQESGGMTVGGTNLFNTDAGFARSVDTLAPRPRTYDPIRTLSSPAFFDLPELPAVGP